MIKTAIIGAASPIAGELLRILVNHPEVEIVTAYQPELARHDASTIHLGLIGEQLIEFTEKINPANIDVVFICNAEEMSDYIIEHLSDYPELRVIDLSRKYLQSPDGEDFVFGISEMNRKTLVRGAKYASLPKAMEDAVLIALFPLAIANVLPSGNIRFEISAPEIQDNTAAFTIERKIENIIGQYQPDFNTRINLAVSPKSSTRGLHAHCVIPSNMDLNDVNKIFDHVYDDHNFTFFVNRLLDEREVIGTNKCLISLTKPSEGELAIDVILDPMVRGNAGEAVHIMNLLFALHERVGLTFKVSNAYECE